jgi:hypothetical protein
VTAVRRTPTGTGIVSTGVGAPAARRTANPVLGLQRQIGNRATGQLLARAPATKDLGSVHIAKLPAIKILGGNAGDWAAKGEPRTLEITSRKGKHSAALARLSNDGKKIPTLKITTSLSDQSGQHLNFGTVELEFYNASIADYTVDGHVETWRSVDFTGVHRLTISHMSGI